MGGSPRASPGGGHVLLNLGLFYRSTEPQYMSTILQLCQLEISTAQSRVRMDNSGGVGAL